MNKIDGFLFEKMIIGGALNLKLNIKEVNDLNVFPIPDGDTGDNMYLTILGGVENIKSVSNNSIALKAEALANGMMFNARGNSGVILSQLFNGLSKGLSGIDEVSIDQFKNALKMASFQAYSAVKEAVEGTILTVAREASEYVCDKKYDSFNDLIRDYKNEMEKSLERTPELLEILKEANVIDSGGAGLLYIVKGFNDVLEGKEIVGNIDNIKQSSIDYSKFNEDSVMEFGYCTEFLLQLQKIKVDVNSFDVSDIIEYLETIGDSIVAYKTGTVVKVHVHTLKPYKALEYAQQFGEFLSVKIENMTLQHNEVIEKKNERLKNNNKRKRYGIVAVCDGQGLIDTLYEMGVDEVIVGGQGNNPSTKSFIDAFEKVNADNIFVLPNNSNIIMAANEAKDLYKGSEVFVINTKDFGQIYSSLSVIDLSNDNPLEIEEMLNEAKEAVVTAMITKSIRDANIDSVEIHKDNYIGFAGKTMYVSCANKLDAYFDLLEKLDVSSKNFMINVFGVDVSEEEKEIIECEISKRYPDLEMYVIEGKQEVYDFIIVLQ